MAYDPAESSVVLFGGATNSTAAVDVCGPADEYANLSAVSLGDTRTYAHGSWTNLTSRLTVSPPARSDAVMAYDPALGAILLFGGIHEQGACPDHTWTWLNDTWEFVDDHWSELFPSRSPSVRMDSAMAWDASDGCLVLFGGYRPAAGGRLAPSSDTWTFSNGSWVNRTASAGPSPAPRALASMASDGQNGAVVLFGGLRLFLGGLGDNDTWSYEDGTWSNLTSRLPISPYPRYGAEMTTAPNGTILLTGGVEPADNDTWAFHSGEWYDLTPNVTSIRAGAVSQAGAAAYPPGNLTLVLGGLATTGAPLDLDGFGSGSPAGTTTLDLATWQVGDPLPNGSASISFPHLSLIVGSLSGTAPYTQVVDVEASGGVPPYATDTLRDQSSGVNTVLEQSTTSCWTYTNPPSTDPNCLYPNASSGPNQLSTGNDFEAVNWSGALATAGSVTYYIGESTSLSWAVEDSQGLLGFASISGSVVGPLGVQTSYVIHSEYGNTPSLGTTVAAYGNVSLQVFTYVYGGTPPYHTLLSYGDGSYQSLVPSCEGGCRHAYEAAGNFTVVATTTDSAGDTVSTVVLNLTVVNGPPPAGVKVYADVVASFSALLPAAAIPTYVLTRRRRNAIEAAELVERLQARGPGEEPADLPNDW
jgi:hypothetical protein